MAENEQNMQLNPQVAPLSNNAGNSEIREILEVLKDIQANEQLEMKYAKKQARRSMIMSLCSLVIVVILAVLIIPIFTKVSLLLDDVNDVVNNAQVSVKNLEDITTELAEVDIDGLFKEVDSLVLESQKSIAEAMDRINDIDFEGLNVAIQNLGTVIQPLSDFFGGKNR